MVKMMTITTPEQKLQNEIDLLESELEFIQDPKVKAYIFKLLKQQRLSLEPFFLEKV